MSVSATSRRAVRTLAHRAVYIDWYVHARWRLCAVATRLDSRTNLYHVLACWAIGGHVGCVEQ
jgi:hypothetical protein